MASRDRRSAERAPARPRGGNGIRGAPAGLAVLVCADLVLVQSDRWGVVLASVALWSIHMSIAWGLLAAMVADTAPADLRGTAYGFFNLVSVVGMLAESVVAHLLWDQLGAALTLYAGAACSVLSLAVMLWRQGGVKAAQPADVVHPGSGR